MHRDRAVGRHGAGRQPPVDVELVAGHPALVQGRLRGGGGRVGDRSLGQPDAAGDQVVPDQPAVRVVPDPGQQSGAVPEPGQPEGDVGRAAARVLGPRAVQPLDDVHQRFTDDEQFVRFARGFGVFSARVVAVDRMLVPGRFARQWLVRQDVAVNRVLQFRFALRRCSAASPKRRVVVSITS